MSAKSRADAVKKLRTLQQNIDNGLPAPDDRLTVTGLIEPWLTEVLPHRVAPATVANYKSLFDTHIKPDLGRKRLTSLQPGDVQRFINQKLESGLSARTVRHLRGLRCELWNLPIGRGTWVAMLQL